MLDGDEVVGFVSANFDEEAEKDHFRSVLWRINVDAEDQGRGVGRFAVEKLLDEARSRGMDRVDVIYEAGQGGPEAFFSRVGFVPVDETEYGEVIAEIRLQSRPRPVAPCRAAHAAPTPDSQKCNGIACHGVDSAILVPFCASAARCGCRFSYAEIVYAWPAVEAAIARALSQQLHLQH